MRQDRLFSLALPVLAILVSTTLLLFPACQNYFNLKYSAQQHFNKMGRAPIS
jgi:hypothetical protein